MLESVQERFTKKLSGLKHMPYKDRLLFLNTDSLELRRLKSDLLQCIKSFMVLMTLLVFLNSVLIPVLEVVS